MMKSPQIIDQTLLDQLSAQAVVAPRGRRNHNFHADERDASHRLLNAIEVGSYVPPHRHLAADKDETLVVVRGRLGLVFFDAAGGVTGALLLTPGGAAMGADIPHGVFHSVLALEAGSVFFEAKAGPYQPLSEAERAPWAPLEGDAAAGRYLAGLRALFP